MSFGFLTESALLPAKSKPIKVDGRSLVDLKAIVYAKEQKVSQEGSLAAGGARGVRGLRGKRSAAGGDDAGRKDVFARRNKGVDDRSERDDLERVTKSKKQKAAERNLEAKTKLYEKMARGEVGDSNAASLVDFSRKTGEDIALLEAKTSSKSQERKKASGVLSSSNAKGSKGKKHKGERTSDSSDDDDDDDGEARQTDGPRRKNKHHRVKGSKNDGDDHDHDHDPNSMEVNITDEFGRERSVPRGGKQHLAFLEAKKAETTRKAELKAEAEAYDERYSYRGNRGSVPAIPGVSSSCGVGDEGGTWAWGSGRGDGGESGRLETREGQERRAAKDMADLLQREGGGMRDESRNVGGAKILSQWEKTLTGDQRTFLEEIHEETEAGRSKRTSKVDGRKLRQDRKELLRQKQEARAKAARQRDDNL